jgi:hypothetical protein
LSVSSSIWSSSIPNFQHCCFLDQLFFFRPTRIHCIMKKKKKKTRNLSCSYSVVCWSKSTTVHGFCVVWHAVC